MRLESKIKKLKTSPFLSIALRVQLQIEVRLSIFGISNEENDESSEKSG